MPVDKAKYERLMQVCQKGYPASNIHVEYANNTLAECYGAIGALMSELKKIDKDRKACWAEFKVQGRRLDQIKAENERLLQALQAIATQVNGNIRPTVRDCVNGQNNVQDIYGYCDQIEAIAAAAMKEPQP
ncbi:hypothetical protein [Pseudomonas sp. NFACC05-1]|uniref:hypothetical protein n=1 Tax=Pseudomonas sp. NFACC05-1 TaxID=1566241 RepID=UPI00087162D2|nr:hypothetical protein [Pseudomonas sp. NFACC05-1]SCW88996.1 hypothetical protein SAMN03159424_03997 [Pseudomonas sp. NFACC05-1]